MIYIPFKNGKIVLARDEKGTAIGVELTTTILAEDIGEIPDVEILKQVEELLRVEMEKQANKKLLSQKEISDRLVAIYFGRWAPSYDRQSIHFMGEKAMLGDCGDGTWIIYPKSEGISKAERSERVRILTETFEDVLNVKIGPLMGEMRAGVLK